MKKTNWLIVAVLAAASLFLLGLWFALGFNEIDNPFDLTLSVVWWVMIIAVVQLIRNAEARRCEALRTCYVSDEMVFNQEAGIAALGYEADAVAMISDIVDNLQYGFDKATLPEDLRSSVSWIVRTHDFDLENEVWKGEVQRAGHPELEPVAFEGAHELRYALNGGVPQEDSSHVGIGSGSGWTTA